MTLSPLGLLNLSFNSLLGSPLRSVLTGVGVFMGVAAVTATLQVKNISQAVVREQLERREAPQIHIWSWWSPGWRGLTIKDLTYLQQRLQKTETMGGWTWTYFETALFQDQSVNAHILSASLHFFTTTGRKKLRGRLFTLADFENYQPVIIIDQVLVNALFGKVDPLKEIVYLDGKPFTVVGIVESKETGFWDSEEPQGMIWMPLSTYSGLSGDTSIDRLIIRSPSLDLMESLEAKAIKLLEQRFPNQEFATWKNIEDIREQQATLEMVSNALLAVGAIALLVGGIGIANITIAAVIERTPEIGLRRAIGATQVDIMFQFILEATLLSIIGGVIAIMTVNGITMVVANVFELPYQFDWNTSGLALGSAVVVGVGAVWVPAIRASQLDPVKALRSE